MGSCSRCITARHLAVRECRHRDGESDEQAGGCWDDPGQGGDRRDERRADHVLAPDYQLVPLSEVEVHSAARGTLPGFPFAGEVAEQGVSFGEMQATHLGKVEELTLHMIEQEKRIAKLEAENAALRKYQP